MLHFETILPETLDLMRRILAQPMPRMLAPFDWNDAKRDILAAVEALA